MALISRNEAPVSRISQGNNTNLMSFDLSLKLMRMAPVLSQQCSLCLFVEVKYPQYQGIRVDYFDFSKIHAFMLS